MIPLAIHPSYVHVINWYFNLISFVGLSCSTYAFWSVISILVDFNMGDWIFVDQPTRFQFFIMFICWHPMLVLTLTFTVKMIFIKLWKLIFRGCAYALCGLHLAQSLRNTLPSSPCFHVAYYLLIISSSTPTMKAELQGSVRFCCCLLPCEV